MPLYPLKFVQRDCCRDDSDHIYRYVYTFHSPVTKLKYVLYADYFTTDAFALKFYAKRDRRLVNKYSRIINRGDTINILLTVGQAIDYLLEEYTNASFAFAGSRSIDPNTNRVEPFSNNQRYRIYKELLIRYVGEDTFEHITYDDVSGYLLLNRLNKEMGKKRKEIENGFRDTYDELLNIEAEE